MKEITLHATWIIKAPIEAVFGIMTDFENFPKYFPKVAETVRITRREGNNLGMDASFKSSGTQ